MSKLPKQKRSSWFAAHFLPVLRNVTMLSYNITIVSYNNIMLQSVVSKNVPFMAQQEKQKTIIISFDPLRGSPAKSGLVHFASEKKFPLYFAH